MVEQGHRRAVELGRRALSPLEQIGESMCTAAGRNPQRMARVGAIGAGLALMSGGAAAQEFCSSNPGQLAGMAVNTVLALVVTAIIIGIVAGAALRSVGLRTIGNVLVGGAGVAILILVGGMWFADSALAFVPGASMDSACGGIGGGGGE